MAHSIWYWRLTLVSGQMQKPSENFVSVYFLMAHSRGLEPPTTTSAKLCSIQLSYECTADYILSSPIQKQKIPASAGIEFTYD